MSLEPIITKIRQKMASAAGFNAKVKFDFGDAGSVFVDATRSPPEIVDNPGGIEPDTTLICTPETFAAIMEGTQDPTMAYMMGKLKVQGSMGLAMKLNAILED